LIISTLILSWPAMMVVHEFGHVLHAWMSGGKVSQVLLHPLTFSRTDLSINPHPLFVAWGGALWGCIFPLSLLLLARITRWKSWYLPAFFSGFCLIANGAYLGVGWLIQAGDAGDLLRQGASPWQLILFGLPAFALGLWLWNGLGPHFGLGPFKRRIDRRAAVVVAFALGSLVLVELLAAGWLPP
jgi:hypothetical protein